MPNDSKFLVLGAAYRLRVDEVWLFVESLRRHYDGPVMLLVTSVDSQQLVAYLRSRDVIPVFFDCPYWMTTHIQLARYIRYGEILRGCDQPYDRILLSDVSDVVFQAHPFATAPAGELLCFLEGEGRTIGQCPNNSMWVEHVFGTTGLARIRDRTVSCSGTTIGSKQAILRYIDLMLSYANPTLVAGLPYLRGHDQGIHNYLLYNGAMPHARLVPNGQHVHTVGCVPDCEIQFGPFGTLLAPGGRLCPIIHQCNYKPAALAHLAAAFAELLPEN